MNPRNLCSACGLDFAKLEGFDYHRVGRHAYTLSEGLKMEPAREDGRRCLDKGELRARGYDVDPRGLWFNVSRREADRDRLQVFIDDRAALAGFPQTPREQQFEYQP